MPDARRRKVHCRRSTKPARADYQNFCVENFFLPNAADLLKDYVTAVAFELLICKFSQVAHRP